LKEVAMNPMKTYSPSVIGLPLALATAIGCERANAQGKRQEMRAAPSAMNSAETTPKPEPEPSAAASAKPQEHVELEIASVANTMAFDKKELAVPAGAEVHLVFKNNSTMTSLPHSWVLVKPGTEASVAAAGLKLGEQAGYIDVRDKDMLVHTPMAKHGDTAEVTFTAPEPGTYPYICTVPGHYMLMKGLLTVIP
jgi:azurin